MMRPIRGVYLCRQNSFSRQRRLELARSRSKRAAPQWDHFREAGLTRYDVLSSECNHVGEKRSVET